MKTTTRLLLLALAVSPFGPSIKQAHADWKVQLYCDTIHSIGEGHAEGGYGTAYTKAWKRAKNSALRNLEDNCDGKEGECDSACDDLGSGSYTYVEDGSVTYVVRSATPTAKPRGGYEWDVRVEATGKCCCVCTGVR